MDTDHDAKTSVRSARLLGGRYRLETTLGRGGVADVYSGVDLHLARRVAVKLFRSPADELAAARMESEATLLASLCHPGLLAVYDFDVDRGEPYLVMQLVEGTTLRHRIDRGPLDPAAVAELGARLAATLDHLHTHEVIHRDVKPSNVLIDRSGTCYLADFGIARAAGTARLTGTGEFVGTAGYLAPEQITDPAAGPAVDIYALGLVLLESLTGEPAYTGSEVETALARLARQPRIPDWLPPAWQTLLTAMTARDPADRPTARRCAELLDALSTQPTIAPQTTPTPARDRPRRMHALFATTGAALSAVVIAGLGSSSTTLSGQPLPETPTPQPSVSEFQPNHPPALPTTAGTPPSPPATPIPASPASPASRAEQASKNTPAKPRKSDQPQNGKARNGNAPAGAQQ